jgi:hypothetical protein
MAAEGQMAAQQDAMGSMGDTGSSEEGSDEDPNQESRRHRHRGSYLAERKSLSKVMKARRLDWQREFDRKPESRYAEDKLAKILQQDKELAAKLRRIEGLAEDIRQAIRR